jgi:hypothetical protein
MLSLVWLESGKEAMYGHRFLFFLHILQETHEFSNNYEPRACKVLAYKGELYFAFAIMVGVRK